ncbi:protein gurken [Drosophila gunungcola]|uniref:EGF-like domain-containing protein n=1 Tax=Drosophila gunungcola TaxID=103775 RepID=A0A9P9YS61_9MUSC|nr:protein gurken [Drosophila gunungcola]XP_052853010.1 protein gurken [Drosophila gunungcola]KAI8042101.1 hypothetical protein M5D96_003403 [Drosophila gunungcola]
MMRFPFTRIFKVIFVLSTIVAVTDCCSSRILLLREHTLKIVQHQHSHMHEHAHELQQQIQETAVELFNRLELQSKQLEASAQEAAEQLHPETDLKPDMDSQLYEQPVEETTGEVEPARAADILDASTATWLTSDSSTPTTAPKTVTTPATVTHTGEPPPDDQSSSSPPESSTPAPATDRESIQSKETEIQMLPCSGAYNTSFCLNGGTCFQHPMVNNTVFHSCLCVNDYDGERCAYKNWNGDYLYSPIAQRKVRMAHIVFSFPVLIMLSSLYMLFAAVFILRNVPDYRRKQQQLHLHKQRFFVRC